ncbi:hypothetical protein K0H71_19250 [Bacillus sp. IITD106]|nr:hypothetical protein [Bacillus sp. IITD106]
MSIQEVVNLYYILLVVIVAGSIVIGVISKSHRLGFLLVLHVYFSF